LMMKTVLVEAVQKESQVIANEMKQSIFVEYQQIASLSRYQSGSFAMTVFRLFGQPVFIYRLEAGDPYCCTADKNVSCTY